MTPQPLVELRDVCKSFDRLRALAPTDLAIGSGEIVGLVGENGAGKSTLIKLLSGVHVPDGGTIRIAGRQLRFASPRDALDAGIATIHQEIECFAHLSVAENILMGEAWPRRRWLGVDWRALHEEAARRMADFGLSLETDRTMAELSAAQRQEVAIAGALSRHARLLILDEPTASLTEPEVERLFSNLRRLRGQGIAMLYVSHRLDEMFELADRVAVLRDGQLVSTHAIRHVTAAQLVHDMVGRPLEQIFPRTRGGAFGPVLLELDRTTRTGRFHDVSLSVRGGEIVGLAGLVGSGRSELARSIYGLDSIDGGTVRLKGVGWKPEHPREALARGLVYIPEERKRQGFVLEHSVADSISIGFSDQLTRWGLIRHRLERDRVLAATRRYDVRAANVKQTVATLSGGNQQKALLARWLERDPDVVILDEPTRGVDIGAKAQIHALIDGLAAQGKAIVLISSDLSEIVGMSDRILVMNRGTVETELSGGELTAHNVTLAASGLYCRANRKGAEHRPT